jgi:hypothetical protein
MLVIVRQSTVSSYLHSDQQIAIITVMQSCTTMCCRVAAPLEYYLKEQHIHTLAHVHAWQKLVTFDSACVRDYVSMNMNMY